MFELRIPGAAGHAWTGDVLTIGRDPSNGWVLSSPGVWGRHAEIRLGQDGRLTIRSVGDAVVSLNGVPIDESPLRWGDSVALGSTVARFHLAAPVQRGLQSWERTLWVVLGLCLASQAMLLAWLQR